MTLITNEIHLLSGLSSTILVSAADRRITKPDGSYLSKRKLFLVPFLNATLSYFGLAEVLPGGKREYLSDWLPGFIRSQHQTQDLKTFADNLRTELHKIIPPAILKQNPSGFHICGYNASQLPEFWSLTNVGRLEGYNHVDMNPTYGSPSSDFLERDAKQIFGWDGTDPASAKNGVFTYRNGDFRSHVAAWESLDEIFSKLLQFPDFRRPTDPQTYGEYVKSKFEIVAYIYKTWAKKQIIGRPIDVIVLSRDLRG